MKRTCIGLLAAATLLAVTAAGPPALAQTNLLANPGFEDNGGSYDGWFTFGGGVQLSLPDGDNIIRTGAAASKIYGEFANCPGSPSFTVGGYGQAFTPVAGMTYELGGYGFVSSEDAIPGTNTCDYNRLIAKVVFFDATSGGNEISSNEIVIGDWQTACDEWIPFSVSTVAPAGAQRVEALFLFLQPACDTGAVYVDDTYFFEYDTPVVPNVLANPSFDGNLTGWDTFGNVYFDGRSWARRTPTGAAKLFSTFTADSPSGMFQMFPADTGSIWKLGCYAMTTCVETPITGSNQNFMLAKIAFFDVDTVEVGASEVVIIDSTSTLGNWGYHEVVGTAPSGTVWTAAYILFVSPALEGGAGWVDDVSFSQIGATAVDPMPDASAAVLRQNIPNPFNPTTRIDFDIPSSGDVELSVYDVSGRFIATLVDGRLEAGLHRVTWDGKRKDGRAVASGVYFYVLKTPTEKISRRMVLLR